MRELRIFMMTVASLVLTVFLGSAGCQNQASTQTSQNRVAAEPRYDDTGDNIYITDPDAQQRGDYHEGPGWDSGRDRDARHF